MRKKIASVPQPRRDRRRIAQLPLYGAREFRFYSLFALSPTQDERQKVPRSLGTLPAGSIRSHLSSRANLDQTWPSSGAEGPRTQNLFFLHLQPSEYTESFGYSRIADSILSGLMPAFVRSPRETRSSVQHGSFWRPLRAFVARRA